MNVPVSRRAFLEVLLGAVVLLGILVLAVWRSWPSEDDRTWTAAAEVAGVWLGLFLACVSVSLFFVGLLRYSKEFRTWLGGVLPPADARFGESLDLDALEAKVEAVVVCVSELAVPRWIVHHLRPEKLAVVFSGDRRDRARELEQEFPGLVDPTVEDADRRGLRLDDPHDVAEARSKARDMLGHLIDGLHIPRERIFVDLTSGPKPVTLGFFEAAEEARVSSLYVRGRLTDPTRAHLGPTQILDPKRRADAVAIFVSDWTEGSPQQRLAANASG